MKGLNKMNDVYYKKEFAHSMRRLSSCIKEYTELSDYQMIFEADDPNVMNTVIKNKQVEQSGNNALTRAMNAIINMIKNLIKTIKDFFATFTMSKSEKNAFYAFREACKKDPSLANKQVHISDWKKAMETRNKQYDNLCAKLDSSMKQMDSCDEMTANKLLADAKAGVDEFIKGSGSALAKDAVVITAGVLEKWGQSSIDRAQQILTILETDQKFYQNLVDSMGQKDVDKYKKRMKQYASRNILMDLKVKLSRKMYDDIGQCVQAEAREISRFGGLGLVASNTGRHLIKSAGKFAKSDIGQETIAQTIEGKKQSGYEEQYKKLMANEPQKAEYTSTDAYNKAHADWKNQVDRLVEKKAYHDQNNRRGKY
jgi:hypothetical protein